MSQLTSDAVCSHARSASATASTAAIIQTLRSCAAEDARRFISALAAGHVLRAERELAERAFGAVSDRRLDGEKQEVVAFDARKACLLHQAFGFRRTQEHRAAVEFAAADGEPCQRVERI